MASEKLQRRGTLEASVAVVIAVTFNVGFII